ncbi:Hypothetical protein NCS54_01258000 [Fusarium falciforme]|uniref:Hypothetical protein n=1 Tax=Fusarium falciforme TaxID=195108 RepID=UPI0023018F0D|nr:Hypothetical protein NCS54_01258000 [Fusarium falciforme]WAO94973.1 Hypothetical protein NCS54_01258000 [Fusarium falciforme]
MLVPFSGLSICLIHPSESVIIPHHSITLSFVTPSPLSHQHFSVQPYQDDWAVCDVGLDVPGRDNLGCAKQYCTADREPASAGPCPGQFCEGFHLNGRRQRKERSIERNEGRWSRKYALHHHGEAISNRDIGHDITALFSFGGISHPCVCHACSLHAT